MSLFRRRSSFLVFPFLPAVLFSLVVFGQDSSDLEPYRLSLVPKGFGTEALMESGGLGTCLTYRWQAGCFSGGIAFGGFIGGPEGSKDMDVGRSNACVVKENEVQGEGWSGVIETIRCWSDTWSEIEEIPFVMTGFSDIRQVVVAKDAGNEDLVCAIHDGREVSCFENGNREEIVTEDLGPEPVHIQFNPDGGLIILDRALGFGLWDPMMDVVRNEVRAVDGDESYPFEKFASNQVGDSQLICAAYDDQIHCYRVWLTGGEFFLTPVLEGELSGRIDELLAYKDGFVARTEAGEVWVWDEGVRDWQRLFDDQSFEAVSAFGDELYVLQVSPDDLSDEFERASVFRFEETETGETVLGLVPEALDHVSRTLELSEAYLSESLVRMSRFAPHSDRRDYQEFFQRVADYVESDAVERGFVIAALSPVIRGMSNDVPNYRDHLLPYFEIQHGDKQLSQFELTEGNARFALRLLVDAIQLLLPNLEGEAEELVQSLLARISQVLSSTDQEFEDELALLAQVLEVSPVVVRTKGFWATIVSMFARLGFPFGFVSEALGTLEGGFRNFAVGVAGDSSLEPDTIEAATELYAVSSSFEVSGFSGFGEMVEGLVDFLGSGSSSSTDDGGGDDG